MLAGLYDNLYSLALGSFNRVRGSGLDVQPGHHLQKQ